MKAKFKQIISGAMVAVMLATSQGFCAFAEEVPVHYTDVETEVDGYTERTFTFSGEVVKTKKNPEYTLDDKLVKELKGVHPRIFFREEDIPAMREKFVNQESKAFDLFIKSADNAVEEGPTEWYVSDNKEENWIRDVANKLCDIALAYVLTEDQKYLDNAIVYIEAISSYPSWGAPGSSYHNNDLAAAHSLTALGLSYDWLFDVLPQDTKDTILAVVKERGTTTNSGGWWRASYLQNHLWNTRTGAAIAATAIMDEYPEAVHWIKNSIKSFNTVFSMLGADGGGHEGMLYWVYGHRFIFQFTHLMKNTWNIDYESDEYIKNCWLSPYYTFLGNNDWTDKLSHMVYGDSAQDTGYNGFYSEVSYVAKVNNNGYAKWFADRLFDYLVENDWSIPYLGIIFDASDVEPIGPENMPTSHLFEDLGMVLSKSDWSGSESMLYLRSGMNTGWGSYKYVGNAGSSHVHPDIASPVVYGYGEFILRDDAYGTTSKTNHSQLFIDGSGQYWDKTKEFLLSTYPYVMKYEDKKDYMYVAMNATDAYGGLQKYIDEFQVKEWIRHCLYLKKRDVLLIVDEVETAVDKELEFRYFPDSQNLSMVGDSAAIGLGLTSKMKISKLDEDPNVTMQVIDAPYRTGTRKAISMKKTGKKWTTAAAVSWSPIDGEPKTVEHTTKGSDWTFSFGGTTAKINIDTHKVSLEDLGADLAIKLNKKILKTDVTPIVSEQGSYMPFSDLFKGLGYKVEYVPETDSVNVTKVDFFKNIPLSSTPCDDKLYEVNGKSMISPQQVISMFDIASYYDVANNMFIVKTTGLSSDAQLASVQAGSEGSLVDQSIEGDVVTAVMLGETSGLSAVATSPTANVVTEQISDKEYKVTITAEDRKTVKEYKVNITRPKGLYGEVGVKNITTIGDDGNIGPNSVDSSPSSYWAYNQQGSWAIYELDEEAEIDRVSLMWNGYHKRVMYFEIYCSMDGEEWTRYGEFTSTQGEAQEYFTLDSPVKCKYVKLVGIRNGINNWCSCCDIGFMLKK